MNENILENVKTEADKAELLLAIQLFEKQNDIADQHRKAIDDSLGLFNKDISLKLNSICEDINKVTSLVRTVESSYSEHQEKENYQLFAEPGIRKLISVYESLEISLKNIISDNASEYLQPIAEMIIEFLNDNEVFAQKSEIGSLYKPTPHSRVMTYEVTADEALNNCIKDSYNTGFYSKNRTFSQEKIVLWQYKPLDNQTESIPQESKE
jgi:hypothetical protein